MAFCPKIKLVAVPQWKHHHSGWPWVINGLRGLETSDGIACYPALEEFLNSRPRRTKMGEDFIGFLHNTPFHPDIKKYRSSLSLEDVFNTRIWLKNIEKCRGLFVMSEYCKNYIDKTLNHTIPVVALKHPIQSTLRQFSFDKFVENEDKQILSIGHWLRNYDIFLEDVVVPNMFRKVFLIGGAIEYDEEYFSSKLDGGFLQSVEVKVVADEEYENLLERNVVFLNLYDASANNVVVECIVRNTPLVINRLAALEEYLGKDYPLFYDSMEEAQQLLFDLDLLKIGHKYLVDLDKNDLTLSYFLNQFCRSEVYKNLPGKCYFL